MIDTKFEGRLQCVEDFLKATDKLIEERPDRSQGDKSKRIPRVNNDVLGLLVKGILMDTIPSKAVMLDMVHCHAYNVVTKKNTKSTPPRCLRAA